MARQQQLAVLGFHQPDFNAYNVAAKLRVHKPRCCPDLVFFLCHTIVEFGLAQVPFEFANRHSGLGLLTLCDLFRHLAADRGNLALQVAHASLARVLPDDPPKPRFLNTKQTRAQPMLLYLLGNEEHSCNTDLLILDVSRKCDNFHAVLQRWRYGVQQVRGRDEHDIR